MTEAPDFSAVRLPSSLPDAKPSGCRPIDVFFLYYHARRQIRPLLRAFADFLRDAYRRTSHYICRPPCAQLRSWSSPA
ncbi:MAG: hypothetical protein JO122_17155 [Acetobacteraceae bacterium]|nr:hypothetical protein [Acetobacteraceae bacterium]